MRWVSLLEAVVELVETTGHFDRLNDRTETGSMTERDKFNDWAEIGKTTGHFDRLNDRKRQAQ
jgi:hypothetical protein